MNLNDISAEALIIGPPIVVGLVEVAKRAGLPEKFAPMYAIIASVGVCTVLITDPFSPGGVLTAILIGLTASGLYDGGKTLIDLLNARKPAEES